MDNFVTVRVVRPISVAGQGGGSMGLSPTSDVGGCVGKSEGVQHAISYVQCPEKYLLEMVDAR